MSKHCVSFKIGPVDRQTEQTFAQHSFFEKRINTFTQLSPPLILKKDNDRITVFKDENK